MLDTDARQHLDHGRFVHGVRSDGDVKLTTAASSQAQEQCVSLFSVPSVVFCVGADSSVVV